MRNIAAALIAVFIAATTLEAVGGRAAMYVGGTLSGVQEKAEGPLTTNDETALKFTSKKGSFEIPYAAIESLEYGQKAGRRVGVAIMISPLALFSKKRNHFITIGFKDQQGKSQAAVLELGKDIVRTTLTVLETRTGKEVEYQDEDARKSGLGGK